MIKIGVIIGSTRPQRFGPVPAKWIMERAGSITDVSFELIDLLEVNLPFLDEPVPPLMQKYSKPHTKAWAEKISSLDGFIWVTPEYNHSVPAALKNAIDFVLHEWSYKPVGMVSYGAAGGGSRAVEHLRGIAGELRMYDVQPQVLIANYWSQMSDNGVWQPSEELNRAADRLLAEVVYWAKVMKPAREELAAKK